MKRQHIPQAALLAMLLMAAAACTKAEPVAPAGIGLAPQDLPCVFPLEGQAADADVDRHIETPPIIPDVQD